MTSITDPFKDKLPEVVAYLKQYTFVNETFFWSPLPKYSEHHYALRIEAELFKHRKRLKVTHLYYVHPDHSFDGLDAFFSDISDAQEYLGSIET